MGEVMEEESRPSPFHERFDIEVGADEAKQRFINRVSMSIFADLNEPNHELMPRGFYPAKIEKHVAYALGATYEYGNDLDTYVARDFRRCLQVLEALYELLVGTHVQEQLSQRIDNALNASEVDLAVSWQPPIFVRTGAPLLDEHLVNEPLRWLSEPRYESVRKPFEKGLSHYLEAQNRPDRLADVVTDMYEAVEALAKIVTGRSGKDLSGNAERFISEVGASSNYKTLLRNYIAYGNEFRHAERESRPRPPLSEPEVESFIYLTGLFIRLAIRTT
jgi:hypothetical protein